MILSRCFIAPGIRNSAAKSAALLAAAAVICAAQFQPAMAARTVTDLLGWEYRWGDSPADKKGNPLWALDGPGGQWRHAPSRVDPPGRNSSPILWMRAPLAGKKIAEPAVYFDCVLYNVEAYHRGSMVYRFGTVPPAGNCGFRGRPWHIVPLAEDYDGTYLYLRICSFDSHIGVPGSIRLGSRPDHISGIIQADFWRAAVSFMFILGGLAAAVLYARRRDDMAILGFGTSLILMAAWNIGNSRIKLIYLNDPILWLYAEHASLYFTPVAIGFFLEQLFGSGPFSAIRRGWQLLLICAAAFLAASAFNPYWLRAYTLRPYQVLMALYLVIVCASIIRKAWRGDIDARIVAAGLAVAIAFALHDIYVSFMGLSFTINKISYWGSLIFLLSLGIVLDRRLRVIPAKIMSFTAERNETAVRGRHLSGANRKDSPPSISPEIREKLDRAVDYLQHHFTENISREGLAGHVGMNHDYFGKMFLLYTGTKVGAFISELRIKMAADLLSSSDRSIVTIAFEAGFESLSTFYRVFQKIAGLSPTVYRARFRKSGDSN